MGSDYRTYQRAIRDLHRECWALIEARRRAIAADPAKWANDTTALTMLVTEKAAGGEPFFDKELAIATCCGFLNGAYDTTHVTVWWVLYHLAANQVGCARRASAPSLATARADAATTREK